MSCYDYFALDLEDAFGFDISLIEEIGEGDHFWRVQTREGEACLKRFRHGIEVETSTRASVYLHSRGFSRTPKVIPTADGRLFVRSPITDPVWCLALFEWVAGPQGETARNGWQWQSDSQGSKQLPVAQDFGRTLASFHEAIRGFRAWPNDRDADFWVRRSRRLAKLVELVRRRLSEEDRATIKKFLQDSVEFFDPLVAESVDRASRSHSLFRSVVMRASDRQELRHCDAHQGNFLVGSQGVMLMDLAEVEAGPRIYHDVRSLWGMSNEGLALRALSAYHEVSPFTADEIELLTIINDPIDNFRRLMDGYLSGDWTEEMILNYQGLIRDYDRHTERLAGAAALLRELAS